MKQRSISKHAIEMLMRQFEPEEILLPDFTTAVISGHCCESLGTIQTHSAVAKFNQCLQIAARTAADIEYGVWWLSLDILQQRLNILADIVITRTFPEFLGALVVMSQRDIGDMLKLLLIQFQL